LGIFLFVPLRVFDSSCCPSRSRSVLSCLTNPRDFHSPHCSFPHVTLLRIGSTFSFSRCLNSFPGLFFLVAFFSLCGHGPSLLSRSLALFTPVLVALLSFLWWSDPFSSLAFADAWVGSLLGRSPLRCLCFLFFLGSPLSVPLRDCSPPCCTVVFSSLFFLAVSPQVLRCFDFSV